MGAFGNPVENETVWDAIGRWARLSPGKPALLTAEGSAVGYRRLAALTTKIRRSLSRLCFGRGDRIAIVHPDGPRYSMLMLGIAGGPPRFRSTLRSKVV